MMTVTSMKQVDEMFHAKRMAKIEPSLIQYLRRYV